MNQHVQEPQPITKNITRFWRKTSPQGVGLPQEEGVYRFRVPLECAPSETIEFLAKVRMRRHGVHTVIFPTFEYFLDDEFLVIPEGTRWREAEHYDPQELGNDSFPVVQKIDHLVKECPFCSGKPTLAGNKIDPDNGDVFATNHPYKFNRFWLTCCEWIAPVPRPSIMEVVDLWNQHK